MGGKPKQCDYECGAKSGGRPVGGKPEQGCGGSCTMDMYGTSGRLLLRAAAALALVLLPLPMLPPPPLLTYVSDRSEINCDDHWGAPVMLVSLCAFGIYLGGGTQGSSCDVDLFK